MTTVPTAGQLAWQEAGFGLFLHFGLNTFHGKEWSDGTLDPATFDPADLDAAQWVDVARRAGARYLVLTAKHHDGFCLWPTDTTTYSVASSPWRGGHGDVVGELAEACRAAGMPLGLYLSPWDRNAACYPDPAAYDEFYLRQLTELCTRYGPLFELWFDGAGSEGRGYDWDAIMKVVDTHQPQAMVFNMGRPTIRWVGNEDGLAADPCTYAVDRLGRSMFTADADSLDGVRYLPPECDVPIRAHWFWQPDDLDTLKSAEHLLAIWYRSVGLGAGLLLNVPPDRRGRLDEHDTARLLAVTAELRRRFATPLPARLTHEPGRVVAEFETEVELDHVELREELATGQWAGAHEVRCGEAVVATGHTVGVRRWLAFPTIRTRRLTITLDDPRARLTAVTGFRTGHQSPPVLEEQPGLEVSKVD
ncbi:alpha-L-fucosidase [Catellatospora paridis]|uniref:alpha-L-fucosidase n=1 Tax=Catellatospora paridis TaxID=1617086 RepID=UPI0012D3CD39|nr:alpha-L-fucosidase [Catellatospora paridis]